MLLHVIFTLLFPACGDALRTCSAAGLPFPQMAPFQLQKQPCTITMQGCFFDVLYPKPLFPERVVPDLRVRDLKHIALRGIDDRRPAADAHARQLGIIVQVHMPMYYHSDPLPANGSAADRCLPPDEPCARACAHGGAFPVLYTESCPPGCCSGCCRPAP